MTISVYWPRKRRRHDLDNALAMTKAATDGLTDAGVFDDDRQIVAIHVSQDRAGPDYPCGCIVFDIEEAG